MKPFLPIDIVLGAGGGGGRLPVPADVDLAHRRVRIVWADGGRLDTALPTRGTALLQHGLKEWAGAMAADTVPPTADAMLRALREVEEADEMPLVPCRADGPWRELLRRLLADAPGQCVGLGRSALLAAEVSVPMILLGADGGLRALAALEARARRLPATRLCAVVWLDDIALGTPSRAHAVPAESVAVLLRWLQQQPSWPCVLLVSSSLVLPGERDGIAGLARHLGGALHRHAGLRREAFGPPPQALPVQKKR